MKVLHLLCELNPSGAETMLLCAASYFQAHGVQSEILATGEKIGVFAPSLVYAGYKIHHIPFKKHPGYFWAVFRLVKSANYDAVHIHSEQASFWVSLVLLLAGIPAKRCIRTLHATFAFSGNLRWRRGWQRKLLHYLGIPYIAISQSVQDTEAQCYGIPTTIIQNWYDSRRFVKTQDVDSVEARAALELRDSHFVVVTVGNCSAIKNHSALIEALSALNNPQIVYLHVGIEKDDSERQLAQQLGIEQQIRFLGQQNNILPFLQAADLFIMPSSYEGFGIAAIEAIATEMPILLSNVPGLKDFAEQFKGIHYCGTDPESMRSAIELIMAIPRQSLRSETQGNMFRAQQRYGIERGVNEYLFFYKGQA